MCCLCVPLFSGVGPIIPEKAAVRVAAHPALAVKEVVRFPLAPMDRWGLAPIPLNTGRDLPAIRPSTRGGAHCYRCALLQVDGGGGGVHYVCVFCDSMCNYFCDCDWSVSSMIASMVISVTVPVMYACRQARMYAQAPAKLSVVLSVVISVTVTTSVSGTCRHAGWQCSRKN